MERRTPDRRAAAGGAWPRKHHSPLAVRWADGLMVGRHRWERVALLLAVLSVAGSALQLSWSVLLAAPWGTGWLLVVVSAAIPILAVLIGTRPGSTPVGAGHTVHLLALLSLAAPAIALLGSAAILAGLDAPNVWAAVESATGLMAWGLMLGVGGGLIWCAAWAGTANASVAEDRP